MKRVTILAALLLSLVFSAFAGTPARLQKNKAGATQLIVDGKPYVMIAGELHNSSNSSVEYMNSLWPALRELNLNTVLASVAWEQVEPEEGKFDFTLVDNLLDGARKNDMKVVILWFGSWKNGESSYAPTWVKRDTKRFPRVRTKDGREIETLSPFGEATMKADAKAYRKLMEHIKAIDATDNTVIAMQPQNEVGIFQDMDYTAASLKAWRGQVPQQLISYMKGHKTTLRPELLKAWQSNGSRTKGTWGEVFGDDAWGKTFFTTWQYATYIGTIAKEGKDVWPLPTFVNSWIVQKPEDLPGVYPNGGPVSRVFDIWKAAAPAVDVCCPDIYLDDFKSITADFHRADNPLLIPESKVKPAQAFWAIGEHSALCYSPFGIEDVAGDYGYAQTCALLREMMPAITEAQGSKRMYGIFRTGDERERVLTFGDYRVTITYEQPQAYGMIIQTRADEFLVAGMGFKVRVSNAKEKGKTAYILQAFEGGFDKDGNWKTLRLLNGDETNHNQYLDVKGRSVVTSEKVYDVDSESRPDYYNPQTYKRLWSPGLYRLTVYMR